MTLFNLSQTFIVPDRIYSVFQCAKMSIPHFVTELFPSVSVIKELVTELDGIEIWESGNNVCHINLKDRERLRRSVMKDAKREMKELKELLQKPEELSKKDNLVPLVTRLERKLVRYPVLIDGKNKGEIRLTDMTCLKKENYIINQVFKLI